MGQVQRTMPVRADRWRPDDPIFDSIVRRCLRNAEQDEAGSNNGELMAGAMVLVLVFVVIMVAAKSVQAAIIVPALVAGGGLLYLALKSGPAKPDRRYALSVVGGPGRLPAGYLVSADAWQAGLAEHVRTVPESQLQAAAEMCDKFQGCVDDLLAFTASLAAHVTAARNGKGGPLTVERRVFELVRIGQPILAEHNMKYPPTPVAAGKGKKK